MRENNKNTEEVTPQFQTLNCIIKVNGVNTVNIYSFRFTQCKNKCHEEERLYGNGTVYNNSEYIVKLDQNIQKITLRVILEKNVLNIFYVKRNRWIKPQKNYLNSLLMNPRI